MATQQVNPTAGEASQPAAGTQPTNHAASNTGFSAEEVERRVNEARRDEKAKLYPEIERAKVELQKKEQALVDARIALETAREGSQRAKTLEEQIKELTSQVAGQTEQFSKAMDDALDNQRKEFETSRRQDQLATQKQALISSTKELIPDMVTGNTPEELQASFEKAKARYKEIADQAEAKVREELGAPLRAALPQPVDPGSRTDTSAADAAGGLDSWRQMPAQEWEQKKRAIKEAAFAKTGLPMKNR